MNFDHYVYPGTNVLVNKFDITDSARLLVVERHYTAKSAAKLSQMGVMGRFDQAHLKLIHKYIFGDIYAWAGKYRDIQIWKGGTEFVEPDKISDRLDGLFESIKNANYFRNLDRDQAADKMADVMAELNLIHPFREGNGRTQRTFIGQLALNAGYDLDFTGMSENDMRNASMAANRGQNNLMRYLFRSNMRGDGVVKGPIVQEIVKKPETGSFGRLMRLFGRKSDSDKPEGPSFDI